MRALILAAGLGTRLRPLTTVRAKAAVPVNGVPLVTRAVSWLVSEGLDDLVVNLHHRPESVTRVIGDGRWLGAHVRYSWEQPVLGSAGGPRHAMPLLVDDMDESFLTVNGDTLTALSLADVASTHEECGALVTMALIENPRPEMYGGVAVDDGWITGFTRPGSVRQSYHFIGVQVIRASALARLQDGVPAESVMGLYPELIRENARALRAHVVDAPFKDIGTPADYLHTSIQLAAVEGDSMASGNDARVHPSASVRNTALWDRVVVGPECQLEECVVCDGVVVPPGSLYRRCALVPFSGEAVQQDERVEGALLVRSF